MSTFRKHFRVVWNEGDPVDVVTNARDVAEAAEHQDGGAGLTSFRLVYSALKRYGIDVPPFDQFMDELDEIQATPNKVDEDDVDPTVPMAYTAEPLPSASSPVLASANG
jgi:hypothetical protein